MLSAVKPAHARESTFEDRDELPFGDFCFSCGNATQGGSYCSTACRESDFQQASVSPEFSPYLSPVPPLISSGKSACSTPPSSATNSPLQSSQSDLADPPSLDLPPPKAAYTFAHSLPANGLKYPATWSIHYQPEPLGSPRVGPADSTVRSKDLSYRRKIDRPHPTIPSPLYFRQKAAAAHASPALNPASPSTAARTPFSSGAHIDDDDIDHLALPQQRNSSQPVSHIVPTPSHCGRPGCVGITKKLRVDTNLDRKTRRKSWQPSPPHPFRGLTSVDNKVGDEVLLSPRIRTLRTGRSASDEGPSTRGLANTNGAESDSSVDDAHSAFACYLFSHLADPAPPASEPRAQRGRAAEPQDEEMKRSRSADGAVPGRPTVGSSTQPTFPATPGRPTRSLFKRGPAAAIRSEPAIERFTPLQPETEQSPSTVEADEPAEEEEQSATVTLPSRLLARQRDDTIRASALPASLTARTRAGLLPGHFIAATTDSPSSSVVSPFPSPPATPPTVGRGRSSSSRRFSIDEPEEGARGRGRLEASSRSRMPSRTSRERGRVDAREEEIPRLRGRTRDRLEEYDADDDRGRGRGRQSTSRSKSRHGRGRARESAGAYGRTTSSDSDQ
ncbi:uncharacterized protein JCM15063_001465 [Sporobolomyces koalae]|uniref:uncharacterized protein n=1 Tax=Sporobolomyces koalae TaxID=500713 RepID=UPI00317AE198